MLNRDYRDIAAGALLMVIGLAASAHALAFLNIGSPRHIGAGGFPMALGFLLAAIGALIMIPAMFRRGTLPEVDLRATAAILTGIVLFAFTIRPLGMIPAILLLTLATVAADNKLGRIGTVILAIVLVSMALLIFKVGLGVPLQAYNWPF